MSDQRPDPSGTIAAYVEGMTGRELVVEFTRTDIRAQPPRNAYGNDAGWDLFNLEWVSLIPGTPRDIRTGIAVNIPEGYYGRIVGRSSAIRNRRIQVQEGIIDAGFHGELFACCVYLGRAGDSNYSEAIQPGDSIAQLIISPVPQVVWHEVNKFQESIRGHRGFGSSGP